ncbi:MAG: CBS domain-containing protein [Chloroflexi bacterium]|nr:CBS domain-containing protein [Chloroflexota bacterium]
MTLNLSSLGRVSRRLSQRLDEAQPSENLVVLALAVTAGLGVGLANIIFHYLIVFFENLAFGRGAEWLSALGPYYVILLPALGALLVGPLVIRLAPEAKGHGVPEVMEAVALRGGRIRPIVAVVKSVASAITIGSGGSAGREGPIVQIGSALGSTLGQALGLSDRRIRTLVACGAAGGISATFNAPIAGVIFAVEVILGEIEVSSLSTVLISSVTAAVLSRAVFGNSPVFVVPEYALVSPLEMVFYLGLGILAALVGIVFVRVLYGAEDLFDRIRLSRYLKPALGGLLVGVIGLFYPQVFGVGSPTVGVSLLGEMGMGLALALLAAKIVATALTLGSGSSGGIFAPSLYMGAMLGAGFGQAVHRLFPTLTAGSGAYAMVGMAAVFTAAARAPLTSIMILFEMTDDYRIILPLMLACTVSTLLARALHRESIYTEKLVRRGVRLERGRDIDVMQGIEIGEVMTTHPETASAQWPYGELAGRFALSHYNGFPVLDEGGALAGVVTLRDYERAVAQELPPATKVRDIATTTSLLVAYPDEAVWVALKRMGVRDVGQLPVVDRQNPKRLVGWIRGADIIRAYDKAIARRVEAQHRADRLRLGRVTGREFLEMVVGSQADVAGQAVKNLHLPQDCLLVSIHRGRRLVVPHGDTVLQPGDKVVALADNDGLAALRLTFEGNGQSRH